MTKHWQTPQAETVQRAARPRSIVFLGTAHDNGGSSILASSIAAAMRAEGHHVEEWYLFSAAPQDLPPGARVFIRHGRSRSPLMLSALFVRVVWALRKLKPDAVFGLQSLSNLLVGIGGLLAGVHNRIATLHIPADRFDPILMRIDRIAGGLGVYSHIIACGQSVADTFAKNGPAYARRMMVIANGHTKPVLIERNKARAKFGRLYYQKNQLFSLDVLKSLPGASLMLVGTGPDEDAVKVAMADGAIAGRAHWQRAIPHSRVGEFYSAVDMVLFPSLFEGLSLAAIEAIHSGVPLLCSDIPSFREMFQHSPFLTETLLLPLGDREAWLERINAIATNSELRARIVDELRLLSPSYAFATMAARYLAVLA
jgi:glycosyltransferase involved in cell wall biosynthesis